MNGGDRSLLPAALGVMAAMALSAPAARAQQPTGAEGPQPVAGEIAAADGEALFRQGRAALAASRYAEALGLFERSQQLDPAAGTLLNAAICEEKLGRLVRARARLREALLILGADDRRRSAAVARLQEIEARIAERAPPAPTLELAPPPPPPPQAPPPAPPDLALVTAVTRQVDEEPQPPVSRRRRLLGYSLAGLGATGLAVGLAAGAGVLMQKGRMDDHCDASGCDPEGMQAASRGKLLSAIATAAAAAGVVGLAGAGYVFMTMPSESAPAAMGGGVSF